MTIFSRMGNGKMQHKGMKIKIISMHMLSLPFLHKPHPFLLCAGIYLVLNLHKCPLLKFILWSIQAYWLPGDKCSSLTNPPKLLEGCTQQCLNSVSMSPVQVCKKSTKPGECLTASSQLKWHSVKKLHQHPSLKHQSLAGSLIWFVWNPQGLSWILYFCKNKALPDCCIKHRCCWLAQRSWSHVLFSLFKN